MTRVSCSVARKKRTKRLLKAVKGFFGDRKNHKRNALSALMKARKDMYIGRKLRKRDFRSLWIVRIGTAAKINGISYSKLMNGLEKANIALNRKMLAMLAVESPSVFAEVANSAKTALAVAHQELKASMKVAV